MYKLPLIITYFKTPT